MFWPRRDVPLVERHVLLDDVGEGLELLGVTPPKGSFTRIICTSGWRWP
jgi:hypothetical protein